MKLMHAKRKRTDGSWTEKQYDVSRRLAGLASMASVSNSEATAEYFYDSEGFDTGYSLTLTNGVSFERILVRPRYMHHRITAITNISSGATRNITYSYDDLDRPVSRGNLTFAYNSRGEVSQGRRRVRAECR